jgi:hypothetical protein
VSTLSFSILWNFNTLRHFLLSYMHSYGQENEVRTDYAIVHSTIPEVHPLYLLLSIYSKSWTGFLVTRRRFQITSTLLTLSGTTLRLLLFISTGKWREWEDKIQQYISVLPTMSGLFIFYLFILYSLLKLDVVKPSYH